MFLEKMKSDKKICKTCNEEKTIDHFFVSKTRKGIKIKAHCKNCFNEIERERYYKKNKHKIEERKKKRLLSKEEYNKQYYQKNKDKIKEVTKKYIENNKDIILKRKSEYYQKNKDLILSKIKNKQKYINQYVKDKRKNDINTKLSHNLRVRINCAIKKNMKWKKSKEILGCDMETFKSYLQSKFKDGMTWENYGSYWHIDHIKPCSSYDLSIKEEQEKCFHYSNLQPLTAVENYIKSDKL